MRYALGVVTTEVYSMAPLALKSIAEIVFALPTHPTSGDVLLALTRAEQAGFDRALHELEARLPGPLPGILMRQAD